MTGPRTDPPFRWHVRLQRYLRRNGQFVAWKDVRDALDFALDKYTRTVRTWTDAVRNGDLSLTQWRQHMRAMIKETHLFATAAARGGWKSLTPADYGRAGAAIKREYAFLDNLARGVSTGEVTLGQMGQRAVLYSQAARETYHEAERDMRTTAGFRYELNQLSAADHCAGCVIETNRGWVRIGQLKPIGTRDCLRNCRCSIAYSRSLPTP